MKLQLDCLPCVVRQAVDAARMATSDPKKQFELVRKVTQEIASLNPDEPTPVAGGVIHHLIQDELGVSDPYRQLKDKHIAAALQLYPRLSRITSEASDPVYTALMLSALGNIIDAALVTEIDLDQALASLAQSRLALCDYEAFIDRLPAARKLLIIGDNAGETVFDRVLIETLQGRFPELEVVYAVRERPIINDATKQDAINSGLAEVAEVISSGCNLPGTVLPRTNREFLHVFEEADIVISKGQGNYEALSDAIDRPVFFLLKAKCAVIATALNVQEGDLIFQLVQPDSQP